MDIEEQDIDLKQLISTTWKGRIFITLFTGVFSIVSVIYILQVPNKYVSYTTLSSAESESSLSSFSNSSLGGLASLAGVSLGQEQTSETQVVLEIMQSWGFIERFIKVNNLEVELMAVKGWDRLSNELIIDSKIYDIKRNEWLREETQFKPSEPTSWELYESFEDILSVTQDDLNGLVTVSIEYYSPNIAKEWINLFVNFVNEHMRVRKLKQTNANIDYLKEQAEKTPIKETKEVFYRLIEEEIKNKMLAEVNYEYSFITVKEAMVPEEKSGPKRFQVVASVTLLGAMLSVIIVLIMHFAGKTVIFIKD